MRSAEFDYQRCFNGCPKLVFAIVGDPISSKAKNLQRRITLDRFNPVGDRPIPESVDSNTQFLDSSVFKQHRGDRFAANWSNIVVA